MSASERLQVMKARDNWLAIPKDEMVLPYPLEDNLSRGISGLNIGFASFRLNHRKEDGVSLEVTEAWERYFTENKAEVFYFAGEIDNEHLQTKKGSQYAPAHFLDAPHPDPNVKKSIQEIQRKLRMPREISKIDFDYLVGRGIQPEKSVSEEAILIGSARDEIKKKTPYLG